MLLGSVAAVIVVAALIVLLAVHHGPGNASSSTTTSAPAATTTTLPPITLLVRTGSGTATTGTFRAPPVWQLEYVFNCSAAPGDEGNLVVNVGRAPGQPVVPDFQPVEAFGPKGRGVVNYHVGGAVYLVINSECSWAVRAAS